MKVLTGDEAPVEGTFIGVNNHKVDVSVGDVAPTPGTFCVPSATLALMERSFGLSSAGDFEAAVTSKRQQTNGTDQVDGTDLEGAIEGAEGAVEGAVTRKRQRTTGTEQVDGTVGRKNRATTTTTTREAGYEYKPVAAQCKPDGKVVGTASGKTLVQCKDFCDTNPLCAAIEFQFATGECLLASGVDKELALQGDGGECNDVSCCYGKPLPAPAGYGLVAARCKPDGKGIGTEIIDTLTECQARCDSTPLCAAFEFELATGECEMVSGVDKELALQGTGSSR